MAAGMTTGHPSKLLPGWLVLSVLLQAASAGGSLDIGSTNSTAKLPIERNCSSLEDSSAGCMNAHRKLLVVSISNNGETILDFGKSDDDEDDDGRRRRRINSGPTYGTRRGRRGEENKRSKPPAGGSQFLGSTGVESVFSGFDFNPTPPLASPVDFGIRLGSSDRCPPPDEALRTCNSLTATRNVLLRFCVADSGSECCNLLRTQRAGNDWRAFRACTCSRQTVCDLEPFVDVDSLFQKCGVYLWNLPGC